MVYAREITGFVRIKAHTRQSSVRGLKDQRLERASNKGARGRRGGQR